MGDSDWLTTRFEKHRPRLSALSRDEAVSHSTHQRLGFSQPVIGG